MLCIDLYLIGAICYALIEYAIETEIKRLDWSWKKTKLIGLLAIVWPLALLFRLYLSFKYHTIKPK